MPTEPHASPRWLVPVIVATIALALVFGFVTLALNGRDTSTYVLFLASPLVTSVVGYLLTARVREVASAVTTVSSELPAAVGAIARHLTRQDETAATIVAKVSE